MRSLNQPNAIARCTHVEATSTMSRIRNKRAPSEEMDLDITTRNICMLDIQRDILKSRTTRTSRSTRKIRVLATPTASNAN